MRIPVLSAAVIQLNQNKKIVYPTYAFHRASRVADSLLTSAEARSKPGNSSRSEFGTERTNFGLIALAGPYGNPCFDSFYSRAESFKPVAIGPPVVLAPRDRIEDWIYFAGFVECSIIRDLNLSVSRVD